MRGDTERKKHLVNPLIKLQNATSYFETVLREQPGCPYATAEQYRNKIKEVLNAGYYPELTELILERIDKNSDVNNILSFVNLDISSSSPSFIVSSAIERIEEIWKKHRDLFSQMNESDFSSNLKTHRRLYINSKSRITDKKQMTEWEKSFQKRLRKAVRYLHDKNYLPPSLCHLIFKTDPNMLNSLYIVSCYLYAIFDYGFPEFILTPKIDDKTWMQAIEFALFYHSQKNPFDITDAKEKDLQKLLDEQWPNIVIYGSFIHTIRLLGNETTYPAIAIAYSGKDPVAEKMNHLQQQANKDKQELAANRETISRLENKVNNLQTMLDQKRDPSRQISALTHDHNKAMKEKEQEIQSLKARISQMEAERMALEQHMFMQDEADKTDKPWLNVELPRENIVFLGGHPNMLKKLREHHPKWIYIGTETEALHNIPKICDYIFVWSGHLSHGIWYHIDKQFEGRERFLFVQATNIQRLEEEMKYELWKRQNTKKEDDQA